MAGMNILFFFLFSFVDGSWNCLNIGINTKWKNLKDPFTRAECIADYLLLKHNAKSKIFVDEIGENHKWLPSHFVVNRGIRLPHEMEKWQINREEMAQIMGEEEARECFETNKAILSKVKRKANSRETNGQNDRRVQIGSDKINEKIEVIRVLPLFRKFDYMLRVSVKYRRILDDQLACLMRFLTGEYGYKNIEWYKLPDRRAENTENMTHKIINGIALWAYKFEEKEHGDIGLRWAWEEEGGGTMLNEIKTKIYNQGEKGFEELHKCADVFYRESPHFNGNPDKNAPISVATILQHFDIEELFLRKIYNKFKFREEHFAREPFCIYCHVEFNVDDDVQQLWPCGHIFHAPCVQQWLIEGKNSKCPHCNTQVKWDEEAFNPSPVAGSSEESNESEEDGNGQQIQQRQNVHQIQNSQIHGPQFNGQNVEILNSNLWEPPAF